MKYLFEFEGHPTKLIIDPAEVAEGNRVFGKLRSKMIEKYGGDIAKVDAELARRLFGPLERFGKHWTLRLTASLENITILRNHVTGIFDAVLNGQDPSVEQLRDDLTKLENEMKRLPSPKQAMEEASSIELGGKGSGLADPIGDLVMGKALGDQGNVFSALDATTQKHLRGLANSNPDLVRGVVVAEAEETFDVRSAKLMEKLKGLSDVETANVKNGLEALNKAWRDERAKSLPVDHILNIARVIGELPTEEMRKAVANSETLRKLAYDNPARIKELWQAFKAKKRGYSFEQYTEYIARHVKGNFGEYGAAFALGEEFMILKGPDSSVTTPGTDLVVVNKTTGEVLIIDNKALSAEELDAVSSLVRNIPKNLDADAAEFQAKAGGPEASPQILAAIERLKKANDEVQALAAGKSKKVIAGEKEQQDIADALAKYNIRRVVTNAGGELKGLSPHLQKLRIAFEDLNRPAPPEAPVSPTIVLTK